MAIAVEQEFFAGRDQRLQDDLVRGRRAVGGEDVLRAPNALAAICCASAITPVGSISESSGFYRHRRSASNTCSPMNS